jgi:hypothetical protein
MSCDMTGKKAAALFCSGWLSCSGASSPAMSTGLLLQPAPSSLLHNKVDWRQILSPPPAHLALLGHPQRVTAAASFVRPTAGCTALSVLKSCGHTSCHTSLSCCSAAVLQLLSCSRSRRGCQLSGSWPQDASGRAVCWIVRGRGAGCCLLVVVVVQLLLDGLMLSVGCACGCTATVQQMVSTRQQIRSDEQNGRGNNTLTKALLPLQNGHTTSCTFL